MLIPHRDYFFTVLPLDTIYRWIEKKNMPAKRVGKKWLFKKEEIDIWIDASDKEGSR